MLYRLIPAVFFIFYLQLIVFGNTRIYLMSEAEINSRNLHVSDICKMEGDDAAMISNIVISPELYKDSIVDNKELLDFLKLTVEKNVTIFGSGVKVKINTVKKEAEPVKVLLIQKNDSVGLSIRKNNITIEMKGKALSSGYEKDEIEFKLSTGKIVKGRIISEKKAEIVL